VITFKAFQGLQNFYIKFQDFPYFSRICTNPGEHSERGQLKIRQNKRSPSSRNL